METLNILYVGSIPHLIREELSMRMPHGFALTFLDDVFDVRTRVELIRMIDFLLGFPRGFGEEMKIMLHLKLVQLLSAGYDRFNIEAQHNWVYLSPTTEAPIKLPLQNTQFS